MSHPPRPARAATHARYVLAAAIVAILTAGDVSAQTLKELVDADKYPLTHDADRATKLRQDRISAYQRQCLNPFLKSPRAKAAWAPKARAALATYAYLLGQRELCGMTDDSRLPGLLRVALDAGCDDPLIRYLSERVSALDPTADPKLLRQFHDSVAALDASTYGDVCKVVAVYDWLAIASNLPPANPLRKDIDTFYDRFWVLFERLAGAGTPVADAALIDLAKVWVVPNNAQTRRQRYEEVADHLDKGKAGKYVRLVIEGRFLAREGWDARGNGAAGSVTAEGWKVFQQRIPQAREKFEAAWVADKTRYEAPTEMVEACRDGGLERATMEVWFARAMEANPDNRRACIYKLDYLQPKWHGSLKEYLSFAWMLATAENVGGLIPHAAIDMTLRNGPMVGPRFARDPEAAGRLYAQPPIWAIFSTACERQLKAMPDNMNLRTVYARGACLAGKLSVAHVQFEKLGGKYNPNFFPDPREYERYVMEAKKAAAAPKK